MFDLVKIFTDNAATYYNFRTGERIRRWPFYVFALVTSVVLSALLGRPSNDFLAGALSAEAILVGFSFNVLFYLVANRRVRPSQFVDIEHEVRFKKLSTLSDEIFANVSYFNVVAIFSALMALLGLLIVSDGLIPHVAQIAMLLRPRFPDLSVLIMTAFRPIRILYFAALIFLIIESISVFLRTVGRVGYYFTSLKIMDTEAENRI